MLRDVFYYGKKPNVHPREKFAIDLADARQQCTTDHFWIVNEFCDYSNFEWDFDFEFLPDEDVWAEEHNNVWPSQHQKDSGTWLCPKEHTDLIVYRSDVNPVKRKNIKSDNWILLDAVDETKFDFSWHPDPTEPAYIYKWGCKFFPVQFKHMLEYRVDGATDVKFMKETVDLLPNDCWVEYQPIDKDKFDLSWRPDPMDPPFIYVWGNKFVSGKVAPTLEYHAPGATERKHMTDLIPLLSNSARFEHLENASGIDYSWIPDPTAPPYIYAWGNQWNKPEDKISIQYVVDGATEYRYMEERATRKPCMDNWIIPDNVDVSDFDFSWEPSPADPPFIYEFGTQHQKTGGPQYVVEGATEKKYLDVLKAKALPTTEHWVIPKNVDITDFDFSWHPDSTDPLYIYQFGTQWALSGGPRYVVPNATEIKYMDNMTARALPNKDNWEVPAFIDADSFDFSWHPYAEDEPFIYQFGTQWQKTGGPRYITPGTHKNSPTSYIDTRILKAKRLPNKKAFAILNNLNIEDFDYSWHPDTTEEPYVYVFGNQWHAGEIMPTIEYNVPGAKQTKYIDTIKATLGVDMSNWEVPDNIDTTGFDFTWKPNPKDPAYIYQFGTQWQKTGGPRYVVPDATDVKYVDTQKVTALPNKQNWVMPDKIRIESFDYSWHPDATEEAYVYQFGTQWQLTGGPKYVVPDAVGTKYIDPSLLHAIAAVDMSCWEVPTDIDRKSFDFSWHPHPDDPDFVYKFGTQWQKTGGPTYVPNVPDSEMLPVKYIDTRILKATKLPSKRNWEVVDNISIAEFDYSWHPDSSEQPFIYVFGNQWYNAEIMPTVKYVVPEATQVKYVNDIKAKLGINKQNWVMSQAIDESKFDFSWVPNPKDPAYIYRWGNKYISNKYKSTVDYVVPSATEIKYMTDDVEVVSEWDRWEIPEGISSDGFDFTWRPDPLEQAFIWQFGTQWQKTGGPRYIAPGATEVKYTDVQKARILPSRKNWQIPDNVDVSRFDFSWHPDANSPPYIYQFGTLQDPNDGPRYITSDNNGKVVNIERVEIANIVEKEYYKYVITTTLEDLINEHPNEIFWAIRENIDYSNFDFTWKPSIQQAQYVHAFGSSDSELTQTYFVNAMLWHAGHKSINYVNDTKLSEEALVKIFKKPSMFLVDRGNPETQKRFEQLKARFPDIQKTRYLNTWVDTISRCINRSSTDLCWILNSELDYSDFNFEYYPNPWQMKMIHVFGTQWSHWGTTFMVNRETFANDTKYIKIIEHLSNLNFVKDQDKRAKATSCLYDVYVVDHGNREMFKTFRTIQSKVGDKSVTNIEYEFSYLHTFRNILKDLPEKKEHYIWICSSVCDYTNFDFTYICDPFAREQLHVFPSDKQKFGDTFLVNINKLRELVDNMNVLQDYDRVNFNQHQRPTRFPAPEVISDSDTHTDSLDVRFDYPYVVLVSEDNKDIEKIDYEPMNLWAPETKNIIVTSTGGTRIVVPREAKDVVKRELYDYPNIIKTTRLAKSKPLDIVFLSNGEPCADENYEHLLNVTKGLSNRIVRVDGVNGRVAAYHAAAEASESPWMFTVFAKLKVSNKFDWNWQPDRLQVPKHYVFHAKNPVNGLVYGHQAMIAYNKKMTLANQGKGLDFTQDDDHEVLNILSGTANFNVDEWTTWRTAFREAIKLCTFADEISQERLQAWTTIGNGAFGQYSIDGANDAVAYFDEVAGDFSELKLSYDWDWLRTKFSSKYNK